MSSIVLAINRHNVNGQTLVTCRVERPFEVANATDGIGIDDNPGSAPFSTPVYSVALGGVPNVQEIGEEIFERLMKHPGVQQLLAANVVQASVEPTPVFFRVDRSQTLPWEALYHPNKLFLALDPAGRWPIARIGGTHGPEQPKRIEVPIRIAAILAAVNRDGENDWNAIYGALRGAIEYRVRVWVAQDSLLAKIRALGDPRVEVSLVPPDAVELGRELAAFRPQILHAFAHGLFKQRAQLEFPTRASHDGSTDQHVYVNAEHLRALKELWLVVLNACGSGAADTSTERIDSLAFELVRNGVPAAIGMRDPIEADDARVFSEAFFREAVRQLAPALAKPGTVTFRWADVLRAPRAALIRKHGGVADEVAITRAEWTLPVLYVRQVESEIEAVHPPAMSSADRLALASELTVILAALRGASPLLGEAAPPEMIARLNQRAREIEQALGG